MIYPAAVFGKL